MTLTDHQIDLIITALEKILCMFEWRGLETAVDALDELLRTVEPGRRPDGDKLLGRPVIRADEVRLEALADQHDDMLDWRWSIGDTAF